MTQFAQLSGNASVRTQFVQGATAEDLESRINAAIAAVGITQLITNITLAGAGDGHTFVATVESADPGDISAGGLAGATSVPILAARCFLAATAESLQIARSAVVPPAPVPNPPLPTVSYASIDTQIAGAAKGTRFMAFMAGVLVAD